MKCAYKIAIEMRTIAEFRVILNDTWGGLQWSVSIVYAYGKSEPQFRKINKCMM